MRPEGLEADSKRAVPARHCSEDPLLQLFHGEPLSVEDFQAALRRQRASLSSNAKRGLAEAAGRD